MTYEDLELMQINERNINDEHICCAIGKDKVNIARVNTKKQWMKKQFQEGLIFKRFDERGKFHSSHTHGRKAV
jgi:hypothetical protein